MRFRTGVLTSTQGCQQSRGFSVKLKTPCIFTQKRNDWRLKTDEEIALQMIIFHFMLQKESLITGKVPVGNNVQRTSHHAHSGALKFAEISPPRK